MPDTPDIQPTDAELEILRVLWGLGPSTVREVHTVLRGKRDAGYTTVLKLMQIMHEKGLVHRNESSRAHVYRAAVTEADTQARMVDSLVDKAFSGSASQLVLRALSARPASAEELAEIRELLDKLEGEED